MVCLKKQNWACLYAVFEFCFQKTPWFEGVSSFLPFPEGFSCFFGGLSGWGMGIDFCYYSVILNNVLIFRFSHRIQQRFVGLILY